jgi:hypothetical protein
LIVGLCSSYLEGPLVQGAIRSLLAACDRVVVFEGPAGAPLDQDVPASDFSSWKIPGLDQLPLVVPSDVWGKNEIGFFYGKWQTDAKKRTAMVESLRPFTEPTWGVWLDGDEVLRNPEYMRDWLQYFDWQEEETGKRNMGWPIKIVEMDGSVAVVQAKVMRIDRLDSFSVSSSVFKNALGQLDARGNYRASISDFPLKAHLEQIADPDGGFMFSWDSFAMFEPYIIHRSRLRHPRRTGLRLHEQEAVEIAKAKAAGVGID